MVGNEQTTFSPKNKQKQPDSNTTTIQMLLFMLHNVLCEKVQGPSSKNRSVDCALVLV